MVDFNRLIGKVRRAVADNPDKVRSGLDRVEGTINSRTGNKYAGKLRQGRGGLESAIGVPTRSRDAFRDEASRPTQRPDTVHTDPVTPPEPVDRPGPIRDERL
ncbi:antitoxin [Agilicoccus flavus]|uniref:antitoxin n=1 Tax=Agilicoccus flavus TaxID=2775968 RepID=UPI001CF6E9E6|nr:antitoxin [Agilicoccus flavus]